MIELQRILCPIDFSDHARHAVEHATMLARWYDSTLTVLYVQPFILTAASAAVTSTLPPSVAAARDREEALASMRCFLRDVADW